MMWVGMFLVFVGRGVVGGVRPARQPAQGLAAALSLLFLGGGYVFTLESQLNWRTPVRSRREFVESLQTPAAFNGSPGAEAVRKPARKAPVFVDFTADWCDLPGQQEDEHRNRVRRENPKRSMQCNRDYTLVPDDITPN